MQFIDSNVLSSLFYTAMVFVGGVLALTQYVAEDWRTRQFTRKDDAMGWHEPFVLPKGSGPAKRRTAAPTRSQAHRWYREHLNRYRA